MLTTLGNSSSGIKRRMHDATRCKCAYKECCHVCGCRCKSNASFPPPLPPCKGYTIPYTQRVNNGTFSSEMYPSMGIASYNAACVFCYNVHRLMGFSKGIARVNQSDLPVLSCDTATFNSCDVDKRKLDLYRDEKRIIVFDYLFLTNFYIHWNERKSTSL